MLEKPHALGHALTDSSAASSVCYDQFAVVAWWFAMKVSVVGSIRLKVEVSMNTLVNVGLGMLAVLRGLKR
jgi:hypothetical protein